METNKCIKCFLLLFLIFFLSEIMEAQNEGYINMYKGSDQLKKKNLLWCLVFKFQECPRKVSEVKVAQLCPTIFNPMDYIVHGILQGRILEWIAIPFSKGSSQLRDWTQVSCIAGRFFNIWATREGKNYNKISKQLNSDCVRVTDLQL